MAILNYTTSIRAAKTLGEIQGILARAGANAVMIQYDGGLPVGLAFELSAGSNVFRYRLPCRHQQILRVLQREAPRYRTPEHALNVAWRILKDWLEAQLALIKAGMTKAEEVFLPYMLAGDGQATVFERFNAERLLEVKNG